MNKKKLVLGCQTFGKQVTEAEAFKILDFSFEHGINSFDLAERYPFPEAKESIGLTERIFGKWINSRRNKDKIFLATKVTGRNDLNWFGVDGSRLTSKRIDNSIKNSLKRLKIENIDLFFFTLARSVYK